MTHTPHELAEEFPHLSERIATLRIEDAHFAKMADEYHALNRAVHRAETLVEPIADGAETDLRKRRAALKDAIYARLNA